jgi:hypothetical protein
MPFQSSSQTSVSRWRLDPRRHRDTAVSGFAPLLPLPFLPRSRRGHPARATPGIGPSAERLLVFGRELDPYQSPRERSPRDRLSRTSRCARSRDWMVPTGMTSHVHAFDLREGGSFRISLTYDAPTGTGKTTAHRKSRGAVCGVAAPPRCAPASPSSRLLASGLAALATPPTPFFSTLLARDRGSPGGSMRASQAAFSQ